jgi:hypothetical protein
MKRNWINIKSFTRRLQSIKDKPLEIAKGYALGIFLATTPFVVKGIHRPDLICTFPLEQDSFRCGSIPYKSHYSSTILRDIIPCREVRPGN